MTVSRFIHKWGLLRTFAVSSMITIILTMSFSGFLLFNFLQTSLLRHDAKVTTDLLQSISSFSNLEEYFKGIRKTENTKLLVSFFERVVDIPDVYRVVVYNADYKILWSNDKNIVGKIFDDNNDLKDALAGDYIFKQGVLTQFSPIPLHKDEHYFLPEDVTKFVESYIPSIGEINGLLEVGFLTDPAN